MAEDIDVNMPMDEFDVELGDLFSAFDGMGASEALKAKAIDAIAAAAGAAGVAGATGVTGAAGVAGETGAAQPATSVVQPAQPVQPPAASTPNMIASAGGKLGKVGKGAKVAAKAVHAPHKIAQIAAIAACASAAVVGGAAYVSGAFAPEQALEATIESTDASLNGSSVAQSNDARASSDESNRFVDPDKGDTPSTSSASSQGSGPTENQDAVSESSSESAPDSGLVETPASPSAPAPAPNRSDDVHQSVASLNYWQDKVQDKEESPLTVPVEEDYGVRAGGLSDDGMSNPGSSDSGSGGLAVQPDWGKLPDDWSALPDNAEAWQAWQNRGWKNWNWEDYAGQNGAWNGNRIPDSDKDKRPDPAILPHENDEATSSKPNSPVRITTSESSL